MQIQAMNIPISKIDQTDNLFNLSDYLNRNRKISIPLSPNLSEINPMIIVDKSLRSCYRPPALSDGQYFIVAGHPALIKNTTDEGIIPVLLITQADPIELWKTAIIYLQRLLSSLDQKISVIEKSLILHYIQYHSSSITPEQLQNKILPIWGDQPSRKRLNQYLELTQIPDIIYPILIEKDVPLKYANAFLYFSDEIIDLLLQLDQQTNLSKSNWIKVIEHFHYLLLQQTIKGQNIEWIKDMQLILTEEISLKQKEKLFIQQLFHHHYPTFSNRLEQIKKIISHLKLPPTMKIHYPENLEGHTLRIELTARNSKELQDLINKLYNIEIEDWNRIYENMDF